jgi:hypothetical protein
MIFKQIYELEAGLKTVTRRVVKPGEYALNVWKTPLGDDLRIGMAGDNNRIGYILNPNGRIKCELYRNYAIVPKRGQSSIGRYQLLCIEQERLQDITEASAVAEGFEIIVGGYRTTSVLPNEFFDSAREGYEALWKSINKTAPYRWQDNPLVWALTLKVLHINGHEVQS